MSKFKRILKLLNSTGTISNSAYFDVDWYSSRYHLNKKECAKHYLKYGYLTNFDPSSHFSTRKYLANNPDVKMNPLLHYEVYGKYEGRLGVNKLEESEHTDFVVLDDNLKKKIQEADVVSFDIFDTLIVRPFVGEEDIYKYIEKKYGYYGYSYLIVDSKYRTNRILNKEVSIYDIYNHIPYRFNKLKDIELQEQINLSSFNQQIKDVYLYCKGLNKKIICISDTYLSSDFEKKLLNRFDINDIEILSSADSNLSKGNGKLYDYVMSIYPNKRILHIGDNYYSDVKMANNRGLDAFQVFKNVDILYNDHNFDYLKEIAQKDNINFSMLIGTVANNYFSFRHKSDDFKFGYGLGGPLALAYLNYLCKVAKQNDVENLLFVARDGYVLKKLYEKYYKDEYKFSCGYAYVTRSCMLSSTLDYAGEERYLSKLLKLAKKSGLDIDLDNDLQKEYESKYSLLKAWSDHNKHNLLEHLKKEKNNSNRVMVVDLNTKHFSSLKACYKLMEDVDFLGMFNIVFGNDSDARYETFACRNMGPEEMDAASISEILLSAPENSIIGIDDDLKPIYEKDSTKDNYQEIMDGIMSFAQDYLVSFDKDMTLLFDEWIDLCECYIQRNSQSKKRLEAHYKNSI